MQGVKETQFPGQLLAASSLLKIFRKTAIFKASLQMFKHVFRGGLVKMKQMRILTPL